MRATVLPAVLALAAPTGAAPISFSEPPDLSGALASPTFVGALETGQNSVQGGLSVARPAAPGFLTGDTFDAFAFTVPVGMVATRVRVDVTSWTAAGQPGGTLPFTPSGNVGNSTGVAGVNALSGVATLANLLTTPDLTLGPGTYTFWAQLGDDPTGRPAGDSVSYAYRYTISAAPLLEYAEGTDATPSAPVALAIAVPAAGGDGFYVRVRGTVSGGAVPNGGGFGWRGDLQDAYTFVLDPALVGAQPVIIISGFAAANPTGPGPRGTVTLANAATGETYTRAFTANGVYTDLLTRSGGSVIGPGAWTLTVAAEPGSPIVAGQSVSFGYVVAFQTVDSGGACCNRWTGGCAVLPYATCRTLGLRFDGAACSPAACRPCPADFDGLNTVDLLDIFAFLTAWFAGCP